MTRAPSWWSTMTSTVCLSFWNCCAIGGTGSPEPRHSKPQRGLLDAFLFDLLIVDLRLGRENGLDLIYQARQEQSAMPAILITGVGDESAKRAAHALQTDCVFRPIVPSALLSLVKDRVASAGHTRGSYLG